MAKTRIEYSTMHTQTVKVSIRLDTTIGNSGFHRKTPSYNGLRTWKLLKKNIRKTLKCQGKLISLSRNASVPVSNKDLNHSDFSNSASV